MTATGNIHSSVPSHDDGWWASVLSDEDQIIIPQEVNNDKNEESGLNRIDCNKAFSVYQKDEIVYLTVIDHNRGGVLVEGEGLSGFVPFSHLVNLPGSIEKNRWESDFSTFIGRKLKLKIIECLPEEGRIIFSERAAQSAAGKRLEIFDSLKPGQVINGVVTNITKFGVFIDLGGVEGLIHISELSWGRVTHPREICQMGQMVRILVIDVSPERSRVALSIKRLAHNPWDEIEKKYSIDQVFLAKITRLVPYGAFARLEEGVEGLIHVSEMALSKDEKVVDFLKVDQVLNVKIILINAAQQRISLGLDR